MMRYPGRGQAALLLYAKTGVVPMYLGGSVLTADDRIVSSADLAALRQPRLVVVRDAGDGANLARGGPAGVPSAWHVIEERRTGNAINSVTVTAYTTG